MLRRVRIASSTSICSLIRCHCRFHGESYRTRPAVAVHRGSLASGTEVIEPERDDVLPDAVRLDADNPWLRSGSRPDLADDGGPDSDQLEPLRIWLVNDGAAVNSSS